jgi:hypothetical protein
VSPPQATSAAVITNSTMQQMNLFMMRLLRMQHNGDADYLSEGKILRSPL